MNGNIYRSLRHITRCVESTKSTKVLFIKHDNVILGELLKVNDSIIFFQHDYDNTRLENILTLSDDKSIHDIIISLYHKYGKILMLNNDIIVRSFRKIIELPDNIEQDIESFISNNKKLFELCVKNFGINSTNPFLIYFYYLSDKSPNNCFWAIKNLYKHHVNLIHIENVLYWSISYKQLINRLSKSTISAYNGVDKVNKLLIEINELRRLKRINDTINQFNTLQKKLLKELELNNKNKETLSKFYTLSETKKMNFIKKMSSVENADEILHQMSLLCNVHFDWNKESLMDFIHNANNINCNIVVDNNNIIIVEVLDYDTVKYLAKSTNWCISKNKTYWNNYKKNKSYINQYVMFNFDKEEDDEFSIVGFTCEKDKGITAAHSFTNAQLMRQNNQFNSLINYRKSIYDILIDNNVPLELFVSYNSIFYDWNRESFFSFLNRATENNYDVYYDFNNKVVLSMTNENIIHIIGNQYRNITDNYGDISDRKHFLFLDFNRNDKQKILFSIIWNDNNIESPSQVYDLSCKPINKTFNRLLLEHELPLDIICRKIDNLTQLEDGLDNLYIDDISICLNDSNIINMIKHQKNNISDKLGWAIRETIFSYWSEDLLNLLYNKNITLCESIGDKRLYEICESLYSIISNSYAIMHKLPSDLDFIDLEQGKYANNNRIEKGLCAYKIFQTIMSNENNLPMMFLSLAIQKENNILTDYILSQIVNNMNPNSVPLEFEKYKSKVMVNS